MHLKEAVLRKKLRRARNEGKEEDAPEVNGSSMFLGPGAPSYLPNYWQGESREER